MTEFKRENRYLVVKLKDAEEFLDTGEWNVLLELAHVVDGCRANCGKRPLRCVVIEDDWPEYETVWNMIEKRVSGKT